MKRPKPATKSAPAAASPKPVKIRKNIMLSESAIEMGKILAAREHRNFSNMLEMLVRAEHERIKA